MEGRAPALFIAGGLAGLLTIAWGVLPLLRRFVDAPADDQLALEGGRPEHLDDSAGAGTTADRS